MFSKLQSVKKTIVEMLQTAGKNPALNKILQELGFRDYDLPLDKSEDSRFLVLLIALMSFLAVLACSGTFALNAMTQRWSSGLENKMTIEIPAETKQGHLLSDDTVKKETLKVAKLLKNHDAIKSSVIMSNEEIQELISPWIGDNLTLTDIPLPGLISVELNNSKPATIEKLKKDISKVSPHAYLETHHEWLNDLIKFTRILKALAIFISLIICVTTLIAIIAGIKTRLAIHKKEVELLHVMGATDLYIARQFQRHALILGGQGSLIGTLCGLIITFIIILLSANSGTVLIPALKIGGQGIMILCIIPIMATLLCALTARYTVLRSLIKMP